MPILEVNNLICLSQALSKEELGRVKDNQVPDKSAHEVKVKPLKHFVLLTQMDLTILRDSDSKEFGLLSKNLVSSILQSTRSSRSDANKN